MQKCDAHDGVISGLAEVKTCLRLGIGIILFCQIVIAPIITGILMSGISTLAKTVEANDGQERVYKELSGNLGSSIDIASPNESNKGGVSPKDTGNSIAYELDDARVLQ